MLDDFLGFYLKDLAVSTSIDDPNQIRREVSVDKIANDEMALDIGTRAIDQFCDIISTAKTIVWNGPMGIAEKEVLTLLVRLGSPWRLRQTTRVCRLLVVVTRLILCLSGLAVTSRALLIFPPVVVLAWS